MQYNYLSKCRIWSSTSLLLSSSLASSTGLAGSFVSTFFRLNKKGRLILPTNSFLPYTLTYNRFEKFEPSAEAGTAKAQDIMDPDPAISPGWIRIRAFSHSFNMNLKNGRKNLSNWHIQKSKLRW